MKFKNQFKKEDIERYKRYINDIDERINKLNKTKEKHQLKMKMLTEELE